MLFKGKEDLSIDSLDNEYVVRQESFFYYMFGVNETGCYAAVNIDSEEVVLFIPKPNLLSRIVMVTYDVEDFKKMYGLRTEYVENMEAGIAKMAPVRLCGGDDY